MLDRERLAKVLAMTTSNHDGEALAAIRKANDIIKGEGLAWDEVLVQLASSLHVSVHRYQTKSQMYEPTEDWTSPHLKDANIINMLFNGVYAKLTPGTEFAGWVDSIHEWWKKHGSLTARQYQGLRNAYNRASK